MVNYLRPSFWSRFLELNRVMWETNAGLTERHAYDSRPGTWPVLRRGINFWTKDHRQVYLIGNPFIWWGSLCAIMVYAGARGILLLRQKRGCKDFQDSAIIFYDQTAGFLALGWMMHFLPFFAMHRQLFIHHYLPALYFSILLFAVIFDVITSALRPKYRFMAAMVMILIAFTSYSAYAPITYATPWTSKSCERARLLKTWDLNCNDFPDTLQSYKNFGPGIYNNKWKNASVPGGDAAAGAGGTFTSDALHQAAVAQAGNHPFEQAPLKVAPSGPNEEAPANIPADKVQADVAPPEPAQGLPEGQAVLEAEKRLKQEVQQPVMASDLKGLDQEGVEGVVLGGTASKKDQPKTLANAATTPSSLPQ
jgi:dolichyl-phosphate-mannose-protein mannosyltransferase